MNIISVYLEKMRGGKQAPPRAPMHEIFWSALGAFIGIFSIYYIGHYQALQLVDSLFLVGSFGATAVLVYGIPNSPFSQPRNIIGGHILSAIVGVSCALLFSAKPSLAAATAVTLSLVLMNLTRTIHPPGGATALIAVIGSEQIHEMAYMFVLTPIATGAVIMLVVAVLINNLSPYRRYPQYWF
ncbi:MAG: HPP family protein [Gammaproteobacteria bacterium]